MRDNPEELNICAIELTAQGHYSEAIACFQRALTLDSTNYLLWYNLGITCRSAGNFASAKNALEYAYELEPEDEDVLDALGLVLINLEEYQKAFEVFQEGLEINPDNSHLWNNMGVALFAQGNYAESSEAFEQALTIYPDYYDALYNLRDTYLELENISGAQICDERIKSLHTNTERNNHGKSGKFII